MKKQGRGVILRKRAWCHTPGSAEEVLYEWKVRMQAWCLILAQGERQMSGERTREELSGDTYRSIRESHVANRP